MQPDEIDDLFDILRETPAKPSDAVMDRVLADALHVQDERAPKRTRPSGRWRQRFGGFGALPAIAGLCSAAVVGLIIGYSDPTVADFLTNGVSGASLENTDLFPTAEFLSTEG